MTKQYVKVLQDVTTEHTLNYLKEHVDVDKPIELHGITLSQYSNPMYLIKLDKPRVIKLSFDDSLWVRLFGNKPQGYYLKNGFEYSLVSASYFETIDDNELSE